MREGRFLSEAPVRQILRLTCDFSHDPTGDDSKDYFIQPTIILTKDPESITMKEEIFGPVITVMVFRSQIRMY
ncbi:uncharacterized protein F5147DRAFT_245765 [Suillus discolor]|uniref:Aldehyde dehydrogenase domain-containing protein n=1 Tax=Suillus discolor TaxID=1912936 RepID=A0A9P7F494_9AGAM|nr:uncharacterized protein F5147DRAFT_245765 [Suillus discolor]KAG2105118.1 hypothetical protein F5147DRAFT_245765 [Suillus discolor]